MTPDGKIVGLPQTPTQALGSKISAVNLAGNWLLHSGIQEPIGGVARYYMADARENRAISTEITGYGISAMLYLYSLSRDERYLVGAAQAGRFLSRLAWDHNLRLFPFEYVEEEDQAKPEPLAYFFDSGIIVRGLLRLWRATKDRQLLAVAQACGRSMREEFLDGGEYHPILKLPNKEPLPRSNYWSRMPGCYQLKSGLAWLDLYQETGEPDYLAWYEDLLERSLRSHESFLPGASGLRVMDRLHAYCYFLEGILPRVDRPEVARALADGITKVVSHSSALGPQFLRSDVCAQLLRVQLLADRAGIATLDRLEALSTAEKIEAFQLEHGDLRIHGGFFFARRDGALQPQVNPVSTAFCAQAIMMWRQFLAGELSFSPDAVI